MFTLADSAVASWLISYHSWIILVGTFFFGDSVVLAASGLAAHGQWSVASVVVWAFLGTVISDSMWFMLADRTLGKIRSDTDRAAAFERLAKRLDGWLGNHPHWGLLFVKFLWGTRTLTIVYMASRKLPLRKFVIFDAFGTLIWLSALVPIGWLAGKGVASLNGDLTRIEYALPVLLVLAIVIKKGRTWALSRRATA